MHSRISRVKIVVEFFGACLDRCQGDLIRQSRIVSAAWLADEASREISASSKPWGGGRVWLIPCPQPSQERPGFLAGCYLSGVPGPWVGDPVATAVRHRLVDEPTEPLT